VPALQVSNAAAASSARTSAFAVRDRARFRSTLLVAQVALAFTLVVGGGLFVRSVLQTRQNLGYNPDGLFLVEVDLRKAGYRNASELLAAYDAITERLRGVPGVEHVAMSSGAFLDIGGPMKVRPSMGNEPDVAMVTVSPGFFDTLGTRLIRGRVFNGDDDASGRKVAVVDESVARTQWPGQDAIGQCTFADDARETCARIVGIVESRRSHLGSARMESTVFTPMAQSDDEEDAPQFAVVRAASTRSIATAIATAARSAIPESPFINVRSLDSVATEQTRSWRLGRTLFGLFAGVGVFLAALGLYSVLALAARQRTTEIGVRMALGARPIDIARLVLGHAMTFVGLGWIAGVAIALAGARFIERLLFQISSTDPAAFAGASLVVVLAGVAGCALPAWRAARLSPVKALRHE
jgi:predicted permease